MALEYLTQQPRSAQKEVDEPQKKFSSVDEIQEERGSKVVFCLLFVAILLALNVAYNFAVAKKGTPILQTIIKNPVFDFVATGKNPLLRKKTVASVGVVKGILHNETNPTALIGIEMVGEGDVILGATVIKIHKDRVEFAKDGFSWTQNVMEDLK